jgi:hypothetical protein
LLAMSVIMLEAMTLYFERLLFSFTICQQLDQRRLPPQAVMQTRLE